ncbi:uncharacterized protein LOC142601504 [Balearica regulorum gibbericeps]|uniref:uncharacterized protein LOC142601504 n=1 Tax=Balearica regulorum gibbericeps TaxID=100784 RepID=UPI003F5DC585
MAVPVLPVPGRRWRHRGCRVAVLTRGKAHPGARARITAPRQRAPRDTGGEDVPGEGWTDRRTEEPQPRREPRGVRSPGKKPACLRRGRRCRLPCTWPVLAGDSPACARPGTLRGTSQLQLGCSFRQVQLMESSSGFAAPAHGWLWLGSAPPCLQLQVQLLDGSGQFQLLFVDASSWLWLQPICSFTFIASGPAHFSALPAPAQLCLPGLRSHR